MADVVASCQLDPLGATRGNVFHDTTIGLLVPLQRNAEHVSEGQNSGHGSIPLVFGRYWSRWAGF